jgi:hypothetical protein
MGFAMCSGAAGRRWGRTLSAPSLLLASLALLVALALPARAQAPRLVDMRPPSVFGSPIVGHILTGFPGVWSSGQALELGYQWRRCPAAGPCSDVPGATSLVYTPGTVDLGARIQLRVSARSGGATEVRDSEPTEPVTDGSGRPAPNATPAPPSPSPSFSAPAPVAGRTRERQRMIDPFPVVRIRGRFSTRWTLFSLVTVRAPAGAQIAMQCTGRGCAFRDRRRTVPGDAPVRITGLERRFAPGARLVVRVTAPDRIGKYTRISVRRGRRPGRWDGCLMPGAADPVACPPA